MIGVVAATYLFSRNNSAFVRFSAKDVEIDGASACPIECRFRNSANHL